MSELLLGAHCSIDGGLYSAFERAEKIDSNVMQIFTQNARQWKSTQLKPESVEIYKTTQKKSKVKEVISHNSYLTNLAAPNELILQKSKISFKEEILRCEALGIKYLVFHPGNHLGSGEEKGIEQIINSLNELHELTSNCKVISTLETTAGQGSSIGCKFEHLKQIIKGIKDKKRIGVCIDTCHIFAAGYDIRTKKEYIKTFDSFEKIIGLKYLKAFHLNDCKSEFNSHVDRHNHIGMGNIGTDAFKFILKDKRFKDIPKVIETPKSKDLREDIENLTLLKNLAKEKY